MGAIQKGRISAITGSVESKFREIVDFLLEEWDSQESRCSRNWDYWKSSSVPVEIFSKILPGIPHFVLLWPDIQYIPLLIYIKYLNRIRLSVKSLRIILDYGCSHIVVWWNSLKLDHLSKLFAGFSQQVQLYII